MANSIESDYSLENLLQTDEGKIISSCIQCGMCAGSCPNGKYMKYTPRKIVNLLTNGMIDEILSSSDILFCVACYNCMTKCPRNIKLTEILLPAVKEKILESLDELPEELKDTLENTFQYGNPMGESPLERSSWIKELDFPIKMLSDDPKPVDILWWIDSYNSYHPRNIQTTINTAKILHKLGVDFGIIGNEESWAGECIRLVGESGLFEEEVEKNIPVLKNYKYNKLLCNDPHAFDSLKHQYPKYDLVADVNHITPFLAQHIDKLKPLLKNKLDYRVTYHDSCVLGRHNKYFEEPRQLLKAINGVKLIEMEHNRTNSICCGGGGGGMWLDTYYKTKGLDRLSDIRVKEAIAIEADIIAVSCPYETTRFEDSLKVLGNDHIQVKDVVDLLYEAMR